MCNEICDKLIHRHPHIYSDVVVKDEEEVKQNWEKLKLKEGKKSVLEGVPKFTGLKKPAEYRIKGVGFDWEEPHQVWEGPRRIRRITS
jgi:XTP/dITP diphosphohydrolase